MHNSGVIPPFFNAAIAIAVIVAIIRAKKKKQAKDQQNQDKPQETVIRNTSQPGQKPVFRMPQPVHKPVFPRNQQTPRQNSADDLQLKRCKGCGGEIPVTMMKCSLCGQSQWGCSPVLGIILLLVVLCVLVSFFIHPGGQVYSAIQNIILSLGK